MQTLRRIFASLGGPSCLALSSLLIWIPLMGRSAHAQTSTPQPGEEIEVLASAAPVIPQQVRYSGKLANRAGQTVDAVFRIYAVQQDGEPLWTETQRIPVGEDGSYSVLLGSTDPSGLPQAVFAAGVARWLGVSVERAPELDRVLLASVPYAMKAGDAETVGGLPAARFVTQEQIAAISKTFAAQAAQANVTNTTLLGSGTTNYVPLWTSSSTLGNSAMYQNGTRLGIGTTSPGSPLQVSTPYAAVTSNSANDIKEFAVSTSALPIASGVTDSGYRMGQLISNYTTDPNFLGTLAAQYGQFVQVGTNTGSGSGTITKSYGIYIDNLALGSAKITNSYGLFQYGSAATNYFGGKLGIGTTAPAATLEVNGTAKFDGNITFASTQTFPIKGTGGGTITGITTSSPLTGSGTSGSVALGLNQSALVTNITPSLESTFDSRYALLSGGDTFSSYVEANQTSGPNYAAVLGLGSNGSVGTFGDSDSGYGVEGETNGGTGVYGTTNNGYGVQGTADGGTGVQGTSNSGYGVYGSSPNNYAVVGITTSGNAVYGQVSTAPQAGIVGRQLDSSGNWGIYAFGNIGASGTKSSVVPVANGTRRVALYAVESPGVWFEDYGSGQLVSGVAEVTIDPAYAQTVNTSTEYHVFVTPDGDCEGLYVTARTATGFEVRELHQGASNVAFDYRIIALRRGYETTRLADVTNATPRLSDVTPPLAHAGSAAGTATAK
ncbi:MAG TPA: hypothetical protein VG225_06610 [Terracidiphilus sp.]|nr:hypothetical protein [Terracidiphilus sp.]